MSGFLDTAYGFVPIATLITEPAVAYGAAGWLIFIDRNPPTSDGDPQRPDLAAIAGLGTENGTCVAFGGWSALWLDERLHTLVGGGYASVNLDFFGVGKGPLNGAPLGYTVEALVGIIEARYRIARLPFHAGLRYGHGHMKVSFDEGLLPPGVTPVELDTNLSGLTPVLIYDTRDNIFTPTKGLYVEAGTGLYSQALGGDADFQSPNEPVDADRFPRLVVHQVDLRQLHEDRLAVPHLELRLPHRPHHLLRRDAIDLLGKHAHELNAAARDDEGLEAVGAEVGEELQHGLVDQVRVRPLELRVLRLPDPLPDRLGELLGRHAGVGDGDHLSEPLLPGRGHRLHVVLEDALERLLGLPLRMLRR